MPTGSRLAGRLAKRGATRGFSYIVLLFVVALAGSALAAIGTQWQTLAQRQRELELLFRGLQLRDALQQYAAATPSGQAARPITLAALLSDERSTPPRHHLRRLWLDPFTGQADWVLLHDDAGHIVGLHSAALRPALRRHALPDGVTLVNDGRSVADWHFMPSNQFVDAAGRAAAPANGDAAVAADNLEPPTTDSAEPSSRSSEP